MLVSFLENRVALTGGHGKPCPPGSALPPLPAWVRHATRRRGIALLCDDCDESGSLTPRPPGSGLPPLQAWVRQAMCRTKSCVLCLLCEEPGWR